MVPLQVLVADDEAVSRTVVGAMLKKAGYPVVFAPDGEQAWQHLSGDAPPPIALLDWGMPGLLGPEVVQRLRGLEQIDEKGKAGDLSGTDALVETLAAAYGKVEAEVHRINRSLKT